MKWNELTMKRKAALMKEAVRHNIVKLSDIKNNYDDGGYLSYMDKLARKKAKDWGEDEDIVLMQMLNDNTYNYKAFYDNDRELALAMLTEDPEAHFSDIGKTVYHPTFSDESIYSGKKSDYNPRGTIGGTWKGYEYIPSKDQLKNRDFNYKETKRYLKGSPEYISNKYNKFDEGGYKSNIIDDTKMSLSRILMNLGRNFAFSSSLTNNILEPMNVAQDTYLVNRKLQEREFKKAGYIKGKDKDYGLVNKAVGDRNIPVFQTKEDSISRKDLVPIGNVSNIWYGSDESMLEHAGDYPTALYVDNNGNMYQKAWDLNDYGDNRAGTKYGNKQLFANILDVIGNPTVVTTGFQPVLQKNTKVNAFNLLKLTKDNIYNFYPELNNEEEGSTMVKENLLETFKDIPYLESIPLDFLNTYMKSKGLELIDMGDHYTYGLPTVEIIAKKNKK